MSDSMDPEKRWPSASGVVILVSRGQLPVGTNLTEIQLDTHSFPNERPAAPATLEKLSTTAQSLWPDISKSNRTNDHKGIPREPLALLRISTSCFSFASSNERYQPPASNWREEKETENDVVKRAEETQRRVAKQRIAEQFVHSRVPAVREYYPGDRFYNSKNPVQQPGTFGFSLKRVDIPKRTVSDRTASAASPWRFT